MQLFAEQLAEILTALVDTKAPQRAAEKRSFFRIGARYRLNIRSGMGGQGKPVEAWLRDVSASGIGIITTFTPPAGGTIVLDLPRQDGTIASVVCTVRNTFQLSPGTHQVGLSFMLPAGEVRTSLLVHRPAA